MSASQGSHLLVVALENAFEIRTLDLAVVVVGARIAAVLGAVNTLDVNGEEQVEKQGGLQIGVLKRDTSEIFLKKRLPATCLIIPNLASFPSRETYRGPVRGVQRMEAHCNEVAEAQRAKAIVSIPRVNDARLAPVPEGHMLCLGGRTETLRQENRRKSQRGREGGGQEPRIITRARFVG